MLHMPPLEREGTQALAMFQMQALHDVVKAGYVRYIGMSSCYAYQCEHITLPAAYYNA